MVVAFGQILPRRAGAAATWLLNDTACAQMARCRSDSVVILEGDAETGVGVMAMEEGLDTGPVLIEERIPIGLLETAHDLGQRLSQLTATLMVNAMPQSKRQAPVLNRADDASRCETERAKQLRPHAQQRRLCARLVFISFGDPPQSHGPFPAP